MNAQDFPGQWQALVRELIAAEARMYAPPETVTDGVTDIIDALDLVQANVHDGDSAKVTIFNLAMVAARAERACAALLPKLKADDVAKLVLEYGEEAA